MIRATFNKLIGLGAAAALVGASGSSTTLAQKGEAPRLREAVAPTYPMLAVYSAAAGKVTVRIQVDNEGNVGGTKVVDGHALLRSPAEDAAKKWRFEASSNVAEVEVVFSFKIMAKGTPEPDLTTRFLPPYGIEIRRTIPEAMTNRDPAPTTLKK